MSALRAASQDTVPTQDETHERIRDLLGAVTTALLEEQPELIAFEDRRPQRDRSSGESWHGVGTLCHVSPLLASHGAPRPADSHTEDLVEVVHSVASLRGMRRHRDLDGAASRGASWIDEAGDRLDLVVGVRVAVRAISAPFLPGSLSPVTTTSPPSPISPLTPPPRPLR